MLHINRVLFENYNTYYIIGSVQWALNGLENQQVENKSCSASQLSTEAHGCLVLLVLNQSDVAGMTLTSQPHGALQILTKASLHGVGVSMGKQDIGQQLPLL